MTPILAAGLDTPIKVRVLHFFSHNPGVMDTPEALARRLGISPAALEEALRDHEKMGLVVRRSVGGRVILLFDASKQRALEDQWTDELAKRREALG